MTIEIDCRKCKNCTGYSCKVYGNNADVAVKNCASDGFKNYLKKRSVWKAKNFHVVFCENCKFEFDIVSCDFIDQMNYCPNCGVDMRGDEQ